MTRSKSNCFFEMAVPGLAISKPAPGLAHAYACTHNLPLHWRCSVFPLARAKSEYPVSKK